MTESRENTSQVSVPSADIPAQCRAQIPDALLSINNLRTYFRTDEGIIKAVDDVSFEIKQGEALGVVGESGSGKSVTALSVMRLIQKPGKIEGGSCLFKGTDLLTLSDGKMRRIRGNNIAMIFQDPMTSLNPLMSVGDQICETVMLHQNVRKKEAWEIGIGMLKKVRIPLPEERMRAYPFEMSGGMRQRAMIAMALSCNPELLIADEPSTALDVTIQAQILELISDLQRDTGMSVWMITHDLGVVAETCTRVVVMYAGMVMEEASSERIFHEPKHPYTIGLLNCLPRVDEKRERLTPIVGQPPNLAKLPPGCPFVERCDKSSMTKLGKSHCYNCLPLEKVLDNNRRVRCWLY